MLEFSETRGRSDAAVGHVEEFCWFFACGDVDITNQARSGGGACVANCGRYGAIDYYTINL